MRRTLAIVFVVIVACRAHVPMITSSSEVAWESTEIFAVAICGPEELLNVQGETGERDDRKSFELNAIIRDGGIAASQFYVVRSWLTEAVLGKVTQLDVTLRATDAGRLLSGTLKTDFEPLIEGHLEITRGLGFYPTSFVFNDVPVACVPELPASLARRHGFLLGP